MRYIRSPAVAATVLAVVLGPLTTVALQAQSAGDGESLFVTQCARCHGIGGHGGQGPSLNRPVLRRAADEVAIAGLIGDGVPEAGMPGNWSLSEKERLLVARYVLSLGQIEEVELAGDVESGRALFAGEGRCNTCHIVNGEGEGIGPDLSDVGARRGADYLRESLEDPGAALPLGGGVLRDTGFRSHLSVRVADSDGNDFRGMRLNEDSFTIQVLDRRGNIWSFRKHELQEFEKEFGESIMQSYSGRLSEDQIEDLVAYMASLRGVRWTPVS